MADNLTDVAENRGLDWLTGNSPAAPVLPLKVALVTANGSDSAPGTEVSGGSYARLNVAFAAASGGATSNLADLVWTGMPAATVVGIEIWDSAGTPVRWWWGPLTASKTLASGDEFKLAAGDIDLTLG
ncbi:phage tail fiber protein [Streptomyces griseosporeus]|uniref:phage tail fiber protein n=1 Tax=Streptomyces griseosporeus TaxID=1910 RepID=UPI0037016BFE